MSARVLVVLAILLGGLGFWGCSGEGCKNPCKQADNCANVNGAFSAKLQAIETGCIGTAPSGLWLSVTAGSLPERTPLTVSLVYFEEVQMQGELCKSSQTSYPRYFDFSAAASLAEDDKMKVFSLAGQFVESQGSPPKIDICANFSMNYSRKDQSCRDSYILYTDASLCD